MTKISRAKIHWCEEEVNAAVEVIKSGRYVKGPQVKGLEAEFSEFVKQRYGIAVNSGTSALIVALMAAGLKKGDEVITTSFTFCATGNSIMLSGAKPVLADINEDTFNINPESIKKAITPKTKAILPVHLYGQSADMDPILEIAEEKDLIVIEDAAQAHGALYKNEPCGSFGDISCFSFYPTKNMTALGDGGILVTNNDDFYEKAVMLRDAGRKKGDIEHSYIPGYNFRLSEILAAMARVQLKHLPAWNEERRHIATWYEKYLSGISGITIPEEMEYAKHIYHLYAIRAQRRDQLLEFLEKNGIEAGTHYSVPLHLQPDFSGLYKNGDLPKSEKAANSQISLPIYPGMQESDIKYIGEIVGKFYKK